MLFRQLTQLCCAIVTTLASLASPPGSAPAIRLVRSNHQWDDTTSLCRRWGRLRLRNIRTSLLWTQILLQLAEIPLHIVQCVQLVLINKLRVPAFQGGKEHLDSTKEVLLNEQGSVRHMIALVNPIKEVQPFAPTLAHRRPDV